MKWYHALLYVTAAIWNLTVCWPTVLLIRLFWGENLRWETNPRAEETGSGPGLWTDLKKDSWPTRSWYRKKVKGKYVEMPESMREVYGQWYTWGATTLGHGGFFGPKSSLEGWSPTKEHEDTHVEQFEASMLRSFIVGLSNGGVLFGLGHPIAALIVFLISWWLGYLLMGIANWSTALLRGEEAYGGSHHEEAAYRAGNEHRTRGT
jgi:hypothetical protein